jgi:uncharacterized membrane protein YedE/YeeE
MIALSALLCGLLFSLGLVLGGMTQPQKIFDFLDFTGQWDPSLGAVMFGALIVYAPAQRLIRRRRRPLLAPSFSDFSSRKIDRPLLLGAALFGAGWGLGGFCPGPALVSLVSGAQSALLFVGAMLAGMLIVDASKRQPIIEDVSGDQK